MDGGLLSLSTQVPTLQSEHVPGWAYVSQYAN